MRVASSGASIATMQCGATTAADRPCSHVISTTTSKALHATAGGSAYSQGSPKITYGRVHASASAVGAASTPATSAPAKHSPMPFEQSRRVATGTASSVQVAARARHGRTRPGLKAEDTRGSAATTTPRMSPPRSASAAALESSHHFSSTTTRRGA
eukprot:871695-Prymnesium_polylepis.2